MITGHVPDLARQRGVAVITALLLTTLAITIVASLFWQQQVQVRSIENQRLQLQKQWILRGALDWTQLILREDAKYSRVDHLGEPWAVSLAETRLDQYVENGQAATDVPDAVLSGNIVDAQSRINLSNLAANGTINPVEVAIFGRLLTQLQQNPALAQATADMMASAQRRQIEARGTASGNRSSATGPLPLNVLHVDDLLAVPGFSAEAFAKLKEFLVVLPAERGRTRINVNTAPAEVLAAAIDTLSLSEAAALVKSRESAWFRDKGDFVQRLGKPLSSEADQIIGFTTGYFLVNGNVRLNRAGLGMQTMIAREGTKTKIVWIREN